MDIFSDLPINTKENDLLNRNDFCNNIANYILSPSSNDGVVISINGKWGSGKTSVANLIKNCIRDREYNKDSRVIPIIVDYTPWNISNNNQIIKQFLNTLSDCFVYKKALKAIAKVLKITSLTVSLFPILPAVKNTIKNVEEAFSKYVNALDGNSGNIEEFKNRVEEHLKCSKLRYVVFIDDLDRLNNEEIRLLIQLIKSTCNFSNITYILLFDKSIVASALFGQQGDVDGNTYLEKIVQMEFNVPRMKHETLLSILGEDLQSLLGEKNSYEIGPRLQDYLSFGLFSQMNTIREEKRFMNNLRFMIDSFNEEIDIVDLIAITYLRTLDENIYKLILDYEDFLLGTAPYPTKDSEYSHQKTVFYKDLEKTKYKFKKHDFLLPELFPHMFSKIPEKHGKQYLSGRLCIPNIFHKYTNMDFDYEDMSLSKINNILKNTDGKALSSFASNLNPDQGRKLLYILDGFSEELKDKEMFKHILSFLFNDFSKLKYSRPFFIVDKSYFVGSICNSLVHNIDILEAEKLLLETVKSTSDISAMVSLCNYISQKKQNKNFDFSSISKDTVESLTRITTNKIIDAFKQDIDGPYHDYTSIIYFVLRNDEVAIKKIVDESDNHWKSIFLGKAASIGNSYSGHKHEVYYFYDIVLLKKVFDFKTVDVGNLIDKATNSALKQRLIALKMQLVGVESKDKSISGFSVSDIQSYCDANNITFKASGNYEIHPVLTI